MRRWADKGDGHEHDAMVVFGRCSDGTYRVLDHDAPPWPKSVGTGMTPASAMYAAEAWIDAHPGHRTQLTLDQIYDSQGRELFHDPTPS